jgi:nucleotide-binding universal stress UspA family protein
MLLLSLIMITNIMLPVDGSSFSEKAGEYAIYLAKHLNAELTAIHVIELGMWDKLDSDYIESKKLKQADICFSSLKDKAAKESVKMETKILVSKDITESILEESRDGDYNLGVIGSHGLSGFKKMILGSITDKVLKNITMPVLVVR